MNITVTDNEETIVLTVSDGVIGGGSPEGTDVLSTGETIGKVLQADGDGTSSWATFAGGGDALVANPLSQFAPTTKAQLDGVISDGDVMYVGDAPTSHTHTASEVTDFDTEVSNNASVVTNTAKISYTDGGQVATNTSKLSGIEANAKDDQTGAEIKALYEAEVNTNAFTDALLNKINSITEIFTTALKSAYDSASSWVTTNGTNVVSHLTDLANPHSVTKAQVGLGNADNTSDANKPVSTAQQTALDLKQDSITLTTTGTSGASTLVSGTLNIPQYSGGGGSPEGTAVLSTGETGGKVLQAVGDGTSSWVALGGGGDMLASNNLSDVANVATARTNLGVDVAGTDNSTDVTLAGTGTYLSLVGQAITVDPITESDISDLGTYSTDIHGNITALNNVSGTNTGDQTSIVGITGTKAQFDTAVTDGNIMYIGDAPTAHNQNASTIDIVDSGALITATDVEGALAENRTAINLNTAKLTADTTNVTSAGALMDSEVTNLAQVKAFNSADYATSAQGTLADSALQSTDIDTLAELNAIVTDATLIDTTDARLSDARTPTAHTHVEADITDLKAYLLPADITGKQDTITLTTTGTSGASTLIGSTLNIPQYTGGGAVSTGTGTAIPLDNPLGAYYNIGAPSTATAFTTTSEAVGGFAVVMSASTTTEPTVTPTSGTATKISGATWVASTDMYLNIYSYDGTNVFYYWTDSSAVDKTDRLEEDATVTTAKDIDWSAYEVFDYTLTGATTLSDINLPTGGSKTITMNVTGNFALTFPTGWTTTFQSGTYDGTVENLIVVQYVKSSTPYYNLQISQA